MTLFSKIIAMTCHVSVLSWTHLTVLGEHSIDQFIFLVLKLKRAVVLVIWFYEGNCFGCKIWNTANDTKNKIKVDFDVIVELFVFFHRATCKNF